MNKESVKEYNSDIENKMDNIWKKEINDMNSKDVISRKCEKIDKEIKRFIKVSNEAIRNFETIKDFDDLEQVDFDIVEFWNLIGDLYEKARSSYQKMRDIKYEGNTLIFDSIFLDKNSNKMKGEDLADNCIDIIKNMQNIIDELEEHLEFCPSDGDDSDPIIKCNRGHVAVINCKNDINDIKDKSSQFVEDIQSAEIRIEIDVQQTKEQINLKMAVDNNE